VSVSSHIVVVNNPGLGHVLPTLDTVAELVRRGHRVTYTATGAAAGLVAAAGAEVLEFESVLAGVDLAAVDTAGESHRLLPLQVRESEAILRAVTARFGAHAPDLPDLVAYDTTVYHAGRILAREWGVPAVALCATLSSNEHFSLLDKFVAVTGAALPRTHPALREFGTRLLRLLAAHGQGDQTIEQFVGRQEGLHLGFYPRSFQYAGDTFDDRHVFVGPHLGAPSADPWTPPPGDRPLLVVSLGTSVHRKPGFFRTCAEALGELPYRVLMTVPEGLDGPLPANVATHRWLPLAEVLAHAAGFVCHGGLGSVMTALANGVPVVVVADGPERLVNAARVEELGLGRSVPESRLTARRLRGAVLEAVTDPFVRAAAEAMRDDIRDAGGGSRAVDAVEGYLKVAGDRAREDNMSGACGANQTTQGDRERLPGACEGES